MKKINEIMVIGENEKSRNSVSSCLQKAGYKILVFEYWGDGNDLKRNIDLVLISDTYFLNQFIVENLRNKFKCPIIVVSEGACEQNILKCLSYQAEDYVLKPVREKELIAKVKFYIEANKEHKEEEISGVIFNDTENLIIIDGNKIKFTKTEYCLCKMMAKKPFSVMSKENLYDSIYEFDTDTQVRTITEYVYSIRNKFKKVNMNPIKTIWGVGYKWVAGQ